MSVAPAEIDLVIDEQFVVVAICALFTKDSIEKALEVVVEPICILRVFSSN